MHPSSCNQPALLGIAPSVYLAPGRWSASPPADPAVTDVWAEPVEGDAEDVAVLRPLLAQTQLESAPLRMAYDADRDGWTAAAFHGRVDTFGAALVLAQTGKGTAEPRPLACRPPVLPLPCRTFRRHCKPCSCQAGRHVAVLTGKRRQLPSYRLPAEGGALVGGYNARGWSGIGEDRDSPASFLFAWRDGDFSKRPVKLPKVPPSCACYPTRDGMPCPSCQHMLPMP